MTTSPPAISAVGLRKAFGGRTVLDGIDLRVPAGTPATGSPTGPGGGSASTLPA